MHISYRVGCTSAYIKTTSTNQQHTEVSECPPYWCTYIYPHSTLTSIYSHPHPHVHPYPPTERHPPTPTHPHVHPYPPTEPHPPTPTHPHTPTPTCTLIPIHPTTLTHNTHTHTHTCSLPGSRCHSDWPHHKVQVHCVSPVHRCASRSL